MNRSSQFDQCEHHLSTLCTRIEMRGKLNLLNLHLHCEDFYLQLLNLLFNYQLKNSNFAKSNAEGIDLVDDQARIVLQVSATSTKAKVTSALARNLSAYSGYSFQFVFICKDASSLRNGKYANPHALVFNPISDIHDVPSLLKIILHMDIVRQHQVCDFLKSELASPEAKQITDSNLLAIVRLLSKEDLSSESHKGSFISFNLDDKIVENNLKAAATVIEDYKIYQHRVEQIYSEFDVAGHNKSKSILEYFRNIYLRLSTEYSADELYFQIVEKVVGKMRLDKNHVDIPLEEIELIVSILAVDAFIRCKIFKAPGAAHVVT